MGDCGWVYLGRGAHTMPPAALRRYEGIFLDQDLVHDQTGLSDRVGDNDDSFVVRVSSRG
jgi:hypothetical protein